MFKAGILVFSAVAISASPALRVVSPRSHRSLISKGAFHANQRRGDLPPVPSVFAALQMQSILPMPTDYVSATYTSSASLPMTTPPYSGPGIAILPNSSVSTALPTRTPSHSKDNQAMSPILRHFAIVGGAIACVLLLTACCFVFSSPRTWKCCCPSRRNKLEPGKKSEDECEPGWTQIDLEPSKSITEKEKLSPSPIFIAKSKFSMGSSEYYGESDISDSYDPSVLSPLPQLSYDAPIRPPTPCPPSPTGSPRPGTPIRPPRPPTEDSPAAIDSMYYADVDDQGFYRHPNPIVLEPSSTVINSPQATNYTSPTKYPIPIHQFFASNPLGIDGLQRHARCQSAPAPTLDRPSTTTYRESDIASIAGTMGSVGSESVYSTMKSQRKSTSAATAAGAPWTQYSEFQQQHHLQLQLQRQSAPSPSTSRGDIGSAY
ncbi:hypothetical protein Agabi119p4_8574 [Agaricus bisporus var. burnettii]|uniref:Uncharacterized protein n=1 Tax=Agaricus bisporus var. burnettii TaxID=192524 RepID=A0A8H7EYI4_AGABI|nr:hypothetical protein Agabi119p4_8574 [Agaricus bisporus var. burnettii]